MISFQAELIPDGRGDNQGIDHIALANTSRVIAIADKRSSLVCIGIARDPLIKAEMLH